MRLGRQQPVGMAVRSTAAGMAAVLVATLSPGVPDAIAAAGDDRTSVPADRSVPVADWQAEPAADTPLPEHEPPEVSWPRAAARVVTLPSTARGLGASAKVDVGGLPVTVSAASGSGSPSQVRVEVLDGASTRPLGTPVAVRVSGADGRSATGRVQLELDYSRFRGGYGADWADRLRLARVPECALAASGAAAQDGGDCPGSEWLDGENDPASGTVSAEVDLTPDPAGEPGALVALLSSPSGENGDFARTDLKASYSWAQGGPSGDFTWSYPIEAPDVPGGLTPSVGLAYGSGAVDGQTSGQNVQPSWAGEGWNYSPPYIERTYRPCFDDRDTSRHWPILDSTAALCWRAHNAQLVFDGKVTDILKGDDGVWRLADDDNERVDLLTGADNSDNNGEHWKLTTTDGTEYWFGRHFLPNGKGETNSTAATHVFANHSSDQCFTTESPSVSSCDQAYRWMLDYVVDRHGNEISYWYSREYNQARVGVSDGTYGFWRVYNYHRSIRPVRIEYGTRAGDGPETPAPARVVFTTEDRCQQDCYLSDGEPDPANWPDTPWDLQCSNWECTNNLIPSFFTGRRLDEIATQVRDGGAWHTVDRWSLSHSFPSTGNSTSPALWLLSIRRLASGPDGSEWMPPMTFDGVRMANRAFSDPDTANAPRKYRLVRIRTETGGEIEAVYSPAPASCLSGATPPSPHNNARRCFPRLLSGHGQSGSTWWHKYLVEKVIERDLVGGSPDEVHSYDYGSAGSSTSAQWAHATGPAVWGMSLANRTWSSWRGWARLTVRTGSPGGPRTQTDYLYFRGMHGDRAAPAGGTRSAIITDETDGSTFEDSSWLAGEILRVRVFDESGGQPVRTVRSSPTEINTGTRTVSSVSPNVFKSYITRQRYHDMVEEEWAPGRLGGSISYSWDGLGRATATYDVARDTCTRYDYADNNDEWLLELVSREQVAHGSCDDTPAIPEDLLSDTRYFYDDLATHGAAPTTGSVTKTEVYGDDGWFVTSRAGYDDYGRVISATDGLGRTTTTAYTHSSDQRMTGMAVTNPAGHLTSTEYEPFRGNPVSVIDANGKVTTAAYDPVGRLVKLWEPSQDPAGTPTVEYGYSISKDAPSYVSSRILGPNGNQIASYDIYDGFLRRRQMQETAPDGHRLIADTVYNDRGLEVKTSTFYNADSGPSAVLVAFADTDVDRQVRYVYDGRNRQTRKQDWSREEMLREWVTTYGYLRVTEVPPPGGTATQERFDRLGNPLSRKTYHTRDTSGSYDESWFWHDGLDRLVGAVDPNGNDWEYTYDLAGRKVSTADPDAGTTTMTYDAADQLTSISDARGVTLAYDYDDLGRRTAVHEEALDGPKRAEWRYDTLAKGELTFATRYAGGLAYVTSVTGYDDGYRPLGTEVTIPASPDNGQLAGTYTTQYTYHPEGSLATEALPAVGDLAAETLTYSYTDQGLLDSVVGLDEYVAGTTYRWDGAVAERLHGTPGSQVRHGWEYDEPTGRMLAAHLDTERLTEPGAFANRFSTTYTYDPVGNVMSVAGSTDGVVDQVECFRYDHLRQLTRAWSQQTEGCQDPEATGADSYYRSWSFDEVGNRLSQTDHDPAQGDTTWSYLVGTNHGVSPHQVAEVTATGPKAPAGPQEFAYDQAGNLTLRTTVAGDAQTLAWDAEGLLASVTSGEGVTSYIYDADGQRLIAHQGDHSTLYLGATEAEQTGTGAVLAIRYYEESAVRTGTGLVWMAGDYNGTPVVQIDADTLEVARRRMMPYGEPRGNQPEWTGRRGYVGGIVDGTGLAQLGARGYDAPLGRFTSVDPVMDMTDELQWHGYGYAGNSPVTFTDPDGLMRKTGAGQSSSGQQRRKPNPSAGPRSSSPSPPRPHANPRQSGGGRSAGPHAMPRQQISTERLRRSLSRSPTVRAVESGWLGSGGKGSDRDNRGNRGISQSLQPSRGGSQATIGLDSPSPRGCIGIPFVKCFWEVKTPEEALGDLLGDLLADKVDLARVLLVIGVVAYCEYVNPVLQTKFGQLAVSAVPSLGIDVAIMNIVCGMLAGESPAT